MNMDVQGRHPYEEENNDHWWEVHKFGGTSVASAKCFVDVACIIEKSLKEQEAATTTKNATPNDHGAPHTNTTSKKHVAVVVSAMGAKKPLKKTTDLLLECVTHAAHRRSQEMDECLDLLKQKHLDCLKELDLIGKEQVRLTNVILKDIGDIRDILKTVMLMKWQASRISELVSGYGELWSAQILTSLLQHRQHHHNSTTPIEHKFVYLDARRVITVEEDEPGNVGGETLTTGSSSNNDAVVCWNSSHTKLADIMTKEEEHIMKGDDLSKSHNITYHFVMTGYVAVNTQGVATTLSRDGSDYSAAILGRLLHAKSVTIWTDVNGVLSADPRRVPEAHVIPEVSYTEAMELAYFGAKVIHPKTMQPAIEHSYEDGRRSRGNAAAGCEYLPNDNGTKILSPIPIWIRNTFEPEHPGSRIYTTSTTHTERDQCVCGFSTMDEMALINIEGTGMMGVHGVASRLFATLQRVKVNVVLIAQASSEHSITFACSNSNNQALVARKAIEETFERELRRGQMNAVELIKPCSIIAAVGDGMSHTTGVSGLFFGALGDAKINLLAISQGCSERNISAVIHSSDSTRALRAVHAAFRLSHAVVRVGIVMDAPHNGDGMHFGGSTLGQSLLDILHKQRTKLRETFDIDLQVCVVCEATTGNTDRDDHEDDLTNSSNVSGRSYRLIVLDPEQRHKVLQDAVTPQQQRQAQGGGIVSATGDSLNNSTTPKMVRNDSITPQDFATFLRLSSDQQQQPLQCYQEKHPRDSSDGTMTSPCRVVMEPKPPLLTTIKSGEGGGVTIMTSASHRKTSDPYHQDVLSRQLMKYLVSSDCAHTVMFDCTAYEEVAAHHATWLNEGVHVVTANSLGLSGSYEQRQQIDLATNKHGKHQSAQYLREVTAAGALPVISTLRDLLHSGDKVRRIDGILSVSLSYILHRISPPIGFNECEQFDQQFYSTASTGSSHHSRDPSDILDLSNHGGGNSSNNDPQRMNGTAASDGSAFATPSVSTPVSFHQAVTEAMNLGLMEHDPMKDLSNEYVARILMVLGKELGLDSPSLSVEQIQLESDMILSSVEQVLTPRTEDNDDNGNNNIKSGQVRKKTLKDGVMHYQKLANELDVKMAERVARAASKGCVVRHVASIDVTTRELKVKLLDVPHGHLFATTPPSCAVVRFFTERHDKYPLVVQGPAEGAASTASALLAELLHMLRSKVAPKGGTLARAKPSGSYLSRMNGNHTTST